MAVPVSLGAPEARGGVRRALDWLFQPGRVAAVILCGGIVSGVFTYLALSKAPFESAAPKHILILLLIDLLIGVAFAGIVIWQVVRIVVARRSHSAGAQLHTRLVLLFSLVAVVPTIVVAIFSAITLNLGIEAWSSNRVQTAVDSSVRVADDYVRLHVETIRNDIVNLQAILGSLPLQIRVDRTQLVNFVRTQAEILNLQSIHVLAADGQPILRIDQVGVDMIDPALAWLNENVPYGKAIIFPDEQRDQVRAIMRVNWPGGGYLYIGRKVNPETLAYQQQAHAAAADYKRMEASRSFIEITFVGVYWVVSVLIMMTAAWLGLNHANRIVQPIGRLIGAAERVSNGDLAARVDVGRTRDEIEGLGRAFNRMTGQLQSQRNELVEANRQFDERRRFTEAVLSGVSAGVIGADSQGVVTVVNRSALRLLGFEKEQVIGRSLSEVMPDLMSLLVSAKSGGRTRAQIDLKREDGERRLNVRISQAPAATGDEGLVVTFDDITDLVAAQRTAAWADVARRIAHEIKNPLTPIQLSAERLRRKYKKEVKTDPEVFDQCTDTIIRHVNDIGRMVDEFSSFARMPEPVFQLGDLGDLVRQAVFLQKVALPDVRFQTLVPPTHLHAACDGRLISQMLVNVIKNAGEAIATRIQNEGETAAKGEIKVSLRAEDNEAVIEVVDNGGGWPKALKGRLTEPYVTTRKKGTGLGLAIVQKVIEDHGGRLILCDYMRDGAIIEADSTNESEIVGAAVRMVLPLQRVTAKAERSETPETAEAQA